MKYYVNSKMIEDYIKENDLTKKQFCKDCNISVYVLNKLFNGDLNFGVKELL